MMLSVREIFDRFPSQRHVAHLCKVSDVSVHKWLKHGIPKRHALTLASSQELRRAKIDLADILQAEPEGRYATSKS